MGRGVGTIGAHRGNIEMVDAKDDADSDRGETGVQAKQ